SRAALQFTEISQNNHDWLVRATFASPEAWKHSHHHHIQGIFPMAGAFFMGMGKYFNALHAKFRTSPRRRNIEWAKWSDANGRSMLLLKDISSEGVGAFYFGLSPKISPLGTIERKGTSPIPAQMRYVRRVFPGIWRIGFARSSFQA